MPSYTYKCKKLHDTVVVVSIHDKVEAPKCATCGKPTVKVFAAPVISFKGNGWGHQ